MADRSSIEWTDATWSPIRGCTPISPGCKNCYAMRMAARNLPGWRSPTTGNPFAIVTPSGPRWTGDVELIESKLDEPLHWKTPRRIFVNSVSDTFHADVQDEWIDRIFAVMALCPQHTFMVLTKRADRMRKYLNTEFVCNRIFEQMVAATPNRGAWSWPGMKEAFRHIWLGASVEDQQRADERIPHLLATPAAVRFLSVEPLLEDVGPLDLTGISWVIVGGESGPGARPCNAKWVRSIVRQCREAGVACFVKQLGAQVQVPACRQHHWDWAGAIGRTVKFTAVDEHHPSTGLWRVHLEDRKGGDMDEWPADLRVRQMPEVRNA